MVLTLLFFVFLLMKRLAQLVVFLLFRERKSGIFHFYVIFVQFGYIQPLFRANYYHKFFQNNMQTEHFLKSASVRNLFTSKISCSPHSLQLYYQ